MALERFNNTVSLHQDTQSMGFYSIEAGSNPSKPNTHHLILAGSLSSQPLDLPVYDEIIISPYNIVVELEM